MMARPLLGQAVSLADGGIQVDGERPVAGSRPSGPGPCQQLAAYPVQLTYVAPAEAAQEGTQCGRRFNLAAQHPTGAAGPQCVGVVDAVAASQGRGDQGHQLVSRVRPPRRIPQVEVMVNQLTQAEIQGQGGRQDQPGIVDQAVVVEGNLDAVGVLKW